MVDGETWSGLVLTGGRSSRMGTDKGWLSIDADGTPMLQRVVDVLRRAGADAVVVVARPGQALPPVDAERLDDPPEIAGQGPLAALVAALEHWSQGGPPTRVYLSAVDMPALSVEHVRGMIARLGEGQWAAVPGDGKHLHPLASALVREEAIRHGRALLAQGERRLTALYQGKGVARVGPADLPDPSALENVNTPAQWEAFRGKRGSR